MSTDTLAPAQPEPTPMTAKVDFVGERATLLGKLIKGFILFVPTLGLYRFWLVTQKRRFYWSHTEIDGDPLEYTGSAIQLLVGFLIAVTIFLPLYGFLFYLSLQGSEIVIYGYIAVGLLMYFLAGYAIYRSRRFRLTRTLWRGIRFHQTGSAWGYAWRRMGWTVLMVITLGLAFPFMASNLWRYRINHTWFGDRQFSFSGKWTTIAWPYYLTYILVGGCIALIFVLAGGLDAGAEDEAVAAVAIFGFVPVLVGYLAYLYFRAREVSRFGSCISCGESALKIRVRARSLLGQHVVYALLFVFGSGILAAMIFGMMGAFFSEFVGNILSDEVSADALDPGQLFQLGVTGILALIGGYLAMLAFWSIIAELILALGFWKLAARDAEISNPDALETVKSSESDESPLAGEGLADALNVGGY